MRLGSLPSLSSVVVRLPALLETAGCRKSNTLSRVKTKGKTGGKGPQDSFFTLVFTPATQEMTTKRKRNATDQKRKEGSAEAPYGKD